MRANIWEQNWGRAVDRLREHGHLDVSDTLALKNSYTFLRRCELVLRRYDSRGVSTLPSDRHEQRRVAVRMGYQEFESFRLDYLNARNTINTLYARRITSRKGS